eukprot:6178248-Pleurochrysis_carterae.AAC.5
MAGFVGIGEHRSETCGKRQAPGAQTRSLFRRNHSPSTLSPARARRRAERGTTNSLAQEKRGAQDARTEPDRATNVLLPKTKARASTRPPRPVQA